MREPSQVFMDDLLNPGGLLHPILERVKQDHTLMLSIREDYINICEPAKLKSYFMCIFILTKLFLCDIKITLHSEEKYKNFLWRAQQKNDRFSHLQRKEKER